MKLFNVMKLRYGNNLNFVNFLESLPAKYCLGGWRQKLPYNL
jgi:hypothetical protein